LRTQSSGCARIRVDCGAQAVAYHLARRGEIVPSVATIHRVLVRREWGAATAQASPCCLATIRMAPAQRRLADRRHHLGPRRWANGVDHGHPRRSLSCSGRGPRRYRPHSQVTWEAFTSAVQEWGLPAHVMNDNGGCFTGRLARNGAADFERMLRSAGIKQICSRPGHPQTCGKLERWHQPTKTWLRLQPPARSPEELQDQLDRWRAHYNHARPHKALHGQTPR